MEKRNVSLIIKIIIYVVMVTFTVMTIYPIFWLIVQSFKTTQLFSSTSKLSFPAKWSDWYFGNYPFVWTQVGFYKFFTNSVIYSVITVVAVVLLANMAGFAFAKIPFKITKFFHGLFIIGILLTIQSILIPIFLMINAVNLFNTRLGVLIPYVGLGLPIGVYLFTDFIRNGIPGELIESARIDGASFLRVFGSIVFPLCAPVSITLAIITFISTWNEFILMSLLTSGDKYKSIPAAVGRFAGNLGADYGKLFTSLSISIIPILIFYFIFRKQITKGVAAGAVKG